MCLLTVKIKRSIKGAETELAEAEARLRQLYSGPRSDLRPAYRNQKLQVNCLKTKLRYAMNGGL